MKYTLEEIMICAAAREIRDGETVFVGMRQPLLAFQLAKHTHAPGAIGVFESGLLRDRPASELLHTMCDLPNQEGAVWCTSLLEVMALLHRGRVDVGFLGGAQIDRFGNLNTTWIQKEGQQLRLPGSGGACDIAHLARRVIIMMRHEPHRFVERVPYVTSPGFGYGAGWRSERGLPGGGPTALITTRGLFGFEQGELILKALHPGVSLEALRRSFPWELKISPDLHETPAPTEEELHVLRRLDPQGFWTGRS